MAAGRLLGQLNRATDANDNPLSGAKLYVYEAGTSTLATVYTTSALSTPLSNPVVADSAGLLSPIWADDAEAFDVHLKTSADVSVQPLIENVVPVGAVQDDTAASASTSADLIARAKANGIQINGNMVVSQERGSTASAGLTGGNNAYIGDQWVVVCTGPTVTGQLVATPFPSYPEIQSGLQIKCTVAKASLAAGDRVRLYQPFEGHQATQLAFGTSRKRPVAIGFLVRPSIDIVGYVKIGNAAGNRSCIKRFSAQANTDTLVRFEGSTVFPGCPDGVWPTGNALNMSVQWCFGAGTTFQGAADTWVSADISAGADVTNLCAVVDTTVNIGAVLILPNDQLPTATDWVLGFRSFDAELTACRRYWRKSFNYATAPASNLGLGDVDYYAFPAPVAGANAELSNTYPFDRAMRIGPTMTLYNPSAANSQIRDSTAAADCSASTVSSAEGGFRVSCTGNAGTAEGNLLVFQWKADARL